MWKQQNRVLTAGTLVVRKDYRMRLKDDFSLELTQLKPDDQGTYTCEIDVMGKPISIKHKVSCIAGFIYCIIECFCLWSFLNFYIHMVLGLCFFQVWQKPAWTKSAVFKSLVTKNAWAKEFLHLCSENSISWICGLFFENSHKWKPHHWNPQEPRTRCND